MTTRWAVLTLSALLASCASPLRMAVPAGRVAGSTAAPVSSSRPQVPDLPTGERKTGVTDGDVVRPVLESVAPPPRVIEKPKRPDLSARLSANNALTIAAEGMPMRNFLNYVFGELLKVSYVVVDGAPGLDQAVTLNTQQAVSSRQLFKLVGDLLSQRSLGVTEKDGVYLIAAADGKASGDLPIGFGRQASDVPDAAGKILQIIPLKYGANIAIERTALQLVDVQIQSDPQQSAMFVTGARGPILKVLDLVRLLDQPSVRASRVGLVNLTYVDSKQFTDQLTQLLENEGVPVGVGRADGKNVALVPLEQLGAIAVFATSEALLSRVEFWAKQVDRPGQGTSQRYFIYQPKHARASDLGESLAPLIGANGTQLGNRSRDTRSALGAQANASAGAAVGGAMGSGGITANNALRRDPSGRSATEAPISIQGEGVTLSIDPRSNSLIFYTTGPHYEALVPMIRRLDVPPKQILLEATIAEVSLTGEFANGVEFAFADGKTAGGTLGRIGLPEGGLALNYVANVTDEVRVRLAASDSQVNVLSSPLLMVRDGVQATISVGNDVPTVGATASDPLLSNKTVTSVLYRRTGLKLGIRPTINAQGMVVMEIDQSISNTVPGSSGVSGAPVFFDRQVSTEVVARSGQSVLLAGLISESGSDASSNVPGISRLPLLGNLFRSDSRKKEKTELVLLITPKIIDGPDEWDTVRGGLEKALRHLVLPEAQVRTTEPTGK